MDRIEDAFRHHAAGGGPKYRALMEAIRGLSHAGILQPGCKLPPVRGLADRLGITPGTVARAYRRLSEAGALTTAVGQGTFVPVPAVGVGLERRADHFVDMRRVRLPDLGQAAAIAEELTALARATPYAPLDYTDADASGALRHAGAAWLQAVTATPVDSARLVATAGAQAGIVLVFQTLLKGRRPVVLVEDLCYPGFRRAAALLGASVISVPMDDHGLLPEALDEAASLIDARVLCTCPDVHAPTGRFTPAARRAQIAAVAERHGLHILQDDCHGTLSATPGYETWLPEHTWRVTSLAKTLSSALRVGFVQAPPCHQTALQHAVETASLAPGWPATQLAAALLGRPDMTTMPRRLADDHTHYAEAARAQLSGYTLRWPAGAPFGWLSLPAGWRAAAFARLAERAGAPVSPAEDFAAPDDYAPNAVRIAVDGRVTPASFAAALGRLRAVLQDIPEQLAV